MLDSGSEDYERQILEIVGGLGRDIGVKVHPKRILWLGRTVPAPSFMTGIGSDQCDFDGGDVILPKPLKDKLSPVEWKPLLASQLLYERRSALTIVARWLASGDYGLALALSLVIPITILATWFFSHELRSVRLKADEKAAFIVGPGDFLNVLEKVDSFHIKDIERRKKGGFRIKTSSHFPAIDVRIRRIRSLIRAS